MRAPFQVLVLPYRMTGSIIEYAILKRADLHYWQGIAGGGEGEETPLEAARREVFEETGLTESCKLMMLDSITSLPVEHVVGEFLWGEDVYVIKEYSFAVDVSEEELLLSKEHSAFRWMGYEEAYRELKWDSNRTALWELHKRLTRMREKGDIEHEQPISGY
ncbi:NUDIX hydrolase [Fictibacillus halophilus]|jgi:dihydroneopterin triphosphate diphosphatase|uniref:NUDIX hydrolase n=1 Tax=Fictibacillus halophilus TaxID=1610490 RepID=UPI001CF98ADE|nr:NUDIX pyrophosphatase [Fictibacillus halophilus]